MTAGDHDAFMHAMKSVPGKCAAADSQQTLSPSHGHPAATIAAAVVTRR